MHLVLWEEYPFRYTRLFRFIRLGYNGSSLYGNHVGILGKSYGNWNSIPRTNLINLIVPSVSVASRWNFQPLLDLTLLIIIIVVFS